MPEDRRLATGPRNTRRDLLHQYVRLQRELADADPASGAYDVTIQAFQQMGYGLITAGYEEDLDRLLRIRVLDGGRSSPAPRLDREPPLELHVLECKRL
jgi:hypothetical protein